MHASLPSIIVIAAAAGLASCSHRATTSRQAAVRAAYDSFDLPARKASNPFKVTVRISLDKQLMYIAEGDRHQDILLAAPVCVGAPSSPTPRGTFRVRAKDKNHRANTHGWAWNPATGAYRRCYRSTCPEGSRFTPTPMPYWIEFCSASYGMHTEYVHPRPKSHGCIRMHKNIAPKAFALVRVGTPVIIAGSQPWDATIGTAVPRPVDPSCLPDTPAKDCSPAIFSDHKPLAWHE